MSSNLHLFTNLNNSGISDTTKEVNVTRKPKISLKINQLVNNTGVVNIIIHNDGIKYKNGLYFTFTSGVSEKKLSIICWNRLNL